MRTHDHQFYLTSSRCKVCGHLWDNRFDYPCVPGHEAALRAAEERSDTCKRCEELGVACSFDGSRCHVLS